MKQKNHYGKNVFVTGASSGIGEACALMFAENGCNVTGVSRNTEEKTERFPGGGSLTLRHLDVTDEKAVREFVEKLPQVDIVVLCACRVKIIITAGSLRKACQRWYPMSKTADHRTA